MRVSVASFSVDRLDLIKDLGFPADCTNGNNKWTVVDMEMSELLELVDKLLSAGNTGVMIKPWETSPNVDYIVFVDSAKGGFKERC